ncbi:Intradiol ring-cleavage dioxygenase [Colletotrichum lupini]|nr:Intradiol ring-cleavage dioxygenase [Colletotrichum lupini]
MKFTTLALAALSLAATEVIAHPEKLTKENAKKEAALAGRSTNKCAAAIEKRKAEIIAKRSQRLYERRVENGDILPNHPEQHLSPGPRNYFYPYGVDGELVRHDLRETQSGIDFYLDIGIIDVETCEPLEGASASIWACNATGSYASFTGIDPDTSELLDGWSKRSDGTTDDETFLRGIQVSDEAGMIEFLTKFPGYYTSRSTHIHVAVQANASDGVGFSQSALQHVGQLFFEEDLLSQVYAVSPYSAHLETLNRTTNAEDSVLSSASEDGYSPFISVSLLGDTVEDGLVGYITIGVNSTGDSIATTGTDVNPQGWIPTVSVGTEKMAQATAADRAAGYTS